MEERRWSDKIASQALPILVTAGIAAGIGFIQSLAASVGACPASVMNPAEVGALGAVFKGLHSAFKYIA